MPENAVSIVGNVTREPEMRFLPGGAGVASFGMAVNRKRKQGDEWIEEVSFFDVSCWQSLAENVADSVTKGMRVIVTGRLEQRQWETSEGEKRSKVEIVAESVGPDLRFATTQVTRNERGESRGQRPAPRQESHDDGGWDGGDAF